MLANAQTAVVIPRAEAAKPARARFRVLRGLLRDPMACAALIVLLVVGFAGAYTTFSTFEWESHTLMRDGHGLTGAIYILGSVLLGLIAIRAGVHLARL